ncbi:translational GTPase TypA [Dermatophilus congolensis]|uniref:Large ribosomal subunit assembly factor BipA n=1 Tax=Dermatophilus congolensis TaxID=1863 RepID=A0A239VQW6_9MICO|nr:translational GTPase TypA [Dermatophilus congolensis]MBO3143121.1 translational GTPase TypA [Dermatophilus congolensis]MBO3152107.1 translational GTPase TypA [Dermatophilus congolensis]MBO3160880.1 translational GTPase TypA [Dermatophilus congolensis]MBO3163395.1 translational GTPase TypA [Dermatophilus congolensis]MBO3176945.1 translational GTPase TypA [Dermatophilus congolensis]
MQSRGDIRNVAIVAHVDHGKTTLVDKMLWQGGAFGEHDHVDERAMDSGDLEREKGITILAKNTAIHYNGQSASEFPNGVTINIIDTPGHADFGGEVERGLSMVDGVVLLVDASEGPLPQTRFVLRKALAAKMPVVLCINKVDRPDSRIEEVEDEVSSLFLDLIEDIGGDESQLEFPVVYASAKAGVASTERPADGALPDSENLEPLFKTIMESIPAPSYDEEAPLQAHVTNLDSSNFLGRIALLRVFSGTIKKGQTVAWCRRDGSTSNVRITELLVTEGLERKPAESAGPGDIIAIAGIPDIMIGETLADPEDIRPLPLITVDEPAISMTIGTNTSPLAGKVRGSKVTARLVKDRLDRELIGNVSLNVLPTERPDAWEVQGRGELALAILVEQMRREGFELTVGKPQVVTKEIDGKLHEPTEHLTIDTPEEHLGAITQLLAARKGRMEQMTNHGTGWVRMEFVVPARGLIGFRTEFLTETRGTGIANHMFHRYEPWFGPISTRQAGSLVADRSGAVTAYAMVNLQERGVLFVEPGTEVYEGMIVGENSRADDMDVNITKEKKLTNVRASSADNFEKVIPPKKLSLEQSLEFCRDDECVEVTPEDVRIRKVVLNASDRARAAARARSESKKN